MSNQYQSNKSIQFSSIMKAWKLESWGSLVVQWLRICLPMQETKVQSLAWEDATCCRATEPVCPRVCALQKRSHHNEKPSHCNGERPSIATTSESLYGAMKTQHRQK